MTPVFSNAETPNLPPARKSHPRGARCRKSELTGVAQTISTMLVNAPRTMLMVNPAS